MYYRSSARRDVDVGISSEVWTEMAVGVEKAPDPGVTSHVDVKAWEKSSVKARWAKGGLALVKSICAWVV